MLTLSDYADLVEMSNYSLRQDLSDMRKLHRSKQYPFICLAAGYAVIPSCVANKYAARSILRRYRKKLMESD